MKSPINVFQRTETKYLLGPEEYRALKKALAPHIKPDSYSPQTIANVYYDTPDYQLIRESLEKPVYKEKLRLRSYGTAAANTPVFTELKKKYKGVVYKRREQMCLAAAEIFLRTGAAAHPLSQIQREICYFRSLRHVVPKAYVAYRRAAFTGLQNEGLRITFDWDIRCRSDNLSLSLPPGGQAILPEAQTLMEVKAEGAVPLWLADLLSYLCIYPVSFSKYGAYYQNFVAKKTTIERRQSHVA